MENCIIKKHYFGKGVSFELRHIDGKYYIVKVEEPFYAEDGWQIRSKCQVSTLLPADMPVGGGWWTCKGTSDEAIKEVSKGRSRRAAMRQWEEHVLPEIELYSY